MAKASICAYGESGSGKSTLLSEAADYVMKEEGKTSRIATTEHTTSYQDKVNSGLIEVVNLNIFEAPFEAVGMVSKGYWPDEVDNPKAKWIAPTADTWKKVGLLGFEGLSTFSDYMGGSYVRGGLAARSGRKERVGPAEETISFKDGEVEVGGNPRSHYNIVQTYIHGAVVNSHKFPVYLIWTAHESKAKDDTTGMPLIGPEVFGLKATQHVPRWFANVLHLSKVPTEKVDPKTKDKFIEWIYRMWLKDHYDPMAPSVPIRAKTSISARNQKEVPAFIEGGGLEIGQFFNLLKKYEQLG